MSVAYPVTSNLSRLFLVQLDFSRKDLEAMDMRLFWYTVLAYLALC